MKTPSFRFCISACICYLLIFNSCSYHMMTPDALAQASILSVKGRQGWMFNQHLTFGSYTSEKVHRGWTSSYTIPFIVKFSGAKEKFHFKFADAQHPELTSEVFCLGKITSQELPGFGPFFNIGQVTEDVFSSEIYFPATREYWDLIVHNPNNSIGLLGMESSGRLEKGNRRIFIREVLKSDKGYKNISPVVLGYEFVENDKVIGAVELMNRGRVILSPDISADLKFVLANASAAILLRSQLSTQ